MLANKVVSFSINTPCINKEDAFLYAKEYISKLIYEEVQEEMSEPAKEYLTFNTKMLCFSFLLGCSSLIIIMSFIAGKLSSLLEQLIAK